jgi:hypothetical protein
MKGYKRRSKGSTQMQPSATTQNHFRNYLANGELQRLSNVRCTTERLTAV